MPTKREIYFEKAQHLFVIEQKTLPEVARELQHVSEGTLRIWSSKHGWVEKRKRALSSKDAFHVQLYETARAISLSIEEDIKAGHVKDIPPSRYYALARIIETIPKSKTAEKEAKPEVAQEFSSLENLLLAFHKSLTGGA